MWLWIMLILKQVFEALKIHFLNTRKVGEIQDYLPIWRKLLQTISEELQVMNLRRQTINLVYLLLIISEQYHERLQATKKLYGL